MIIDIITLIILLLAVFKGISRGLLVAVFSLAAFIVGLAAALKLSAVTAAWLGDSVNVSAKWLPVLAFFAVFVIVVLLVNAIGRLLEKSVEWAFLGWLNKAGGIIFFVIIYMLIWSIALFYLDKTEILSNEAMEKSNTYPIIAPWGSSAMEWIGEAIPFFKDVFTDLTIFFEKLSSEIKPQQTI